MDNKCEFCQKIMLQNHWGKFHKYNETKCRTCVRLINQANSYFYDGKTYNINLSAIKKLLEKPNGEKYLNELKKKQYLETYF